MTHTRPMAESEGRFSGQRAILRLCPTCEVTTTHMCWTWDSNCGGYTDYKFKCVECDGVHWVEGADS